MQDHASSFKSAVKTCPRPVSRFAFRFFEPRCDKQDMSTKKRPSLHLRISGQILVPRPPMQKVFHLDYCHSQGQSYMHAFLFLIDWFLLGPFSIHMWVFLDRNGGLSQVALVFPRSFLPFCLVCSSLGSRTFFFGSLEHSE